LVIAARRMLELIRASGEVLPRSPDLSENLIRLGSRIVG
jgi:hypothetical protein